jgi:hypothetical protein
VYVVAGSAGASGGTAANFGAYAMPFAVNDGGLLYFEVEDNRLDAKMLRQNGTIFDQFTIMKDVDKVTTYNILNGSSQLLAASWPGVYNWIQGVAGTSRTMNVTPPNNSTTPYKVTDNFGCVTDSFSVITTGILPVSLIAYEVKLWNGKVEMNWTTASEANNRMFIIERSANSRDFTAIGTVNGAGTTTVQHSYSFYDYSPLPGASYYRLSQIDFDDNKDILGVKKIENATLKDFEAKTMSGYSGKLVLQLNVVVPGMYHLSIYDISGKKWKDENMSLGAGILHKEISLAPGVYIWEVKNNAGDAMLQKVVVQ